MKKLVLCLLILVLTGANIWMIYNCELKPVGTSNNKKDFIVEKGETYISIASKLKSANLIRSELAYKVYLKLNNLKPLDAGKYQLSEDMSVEKIVNTLGAGSNYNNDTISITFKEGKNMRYIASLIEEKTNNKAEDVFTLLKNDTYIENLISEYWFLTDEIKNKEIYYPLEGYLFPDTYEFLNKDVKVETIFKKMLDHLSGKLEPFRSEIEESNYSIHKLITLASIVELEGATSKDRAGVAGVFYNRLNSGWALGSDVTTYYAEKIDDWSQGLTWKALDSCNSYNTRGPCVKGLPVGPICNPGLESLASVFEPESHNNYFFVADCNGKTYLNKDATSHERTIKELRASNLWCEN